MLLSLKLLKGNLKGEEEDSAVEGVDEQVGESSREVIEMIMNVTTMFDLLEEDWTNDVFLMIEKFVVDPEQPVLLIYFENAQLKACSEMPVEPVRDLMYFVRTSEAEITADNFFDEITFGNLIVSVEGKLFSKSPNRESTFIVRICPHAFATSVRYCVF